MRSTGESVTLNPLTGSYFVCQSNPKTYDIILALNKYFCIIDKVSYAEGTKVAEGTKESNGIGISESLSLENLCNENFCHEVVRQTSHSNFKSYNYVQTFLNLDVWQVEYLIKWLFQSKTFRRGFCCYCKSIYKPNKPSKQIFNKAVWIFINISHSDYRMDYSWNYRVCGLINKKVLLDDTMNWLNTLGGGYSALGDQFKHHAIEAGKISFKQLNIGLEMGDPPTVIRCHLYFGLSLMQTGHLRKAKYILRKQFREAHQFIKTDPRLVNMCKGLWSRLSYLYSRKKVAGPS